MNRNGGWKKKNTYYGFIFCIVSVYNYVDYKIINGASMKCKNFLMLLFQMAKILMNRRIVCRGLRKRWKKIEKCLFLRHGTCVSRLLYVYYELKSEKTKIFRRKFRRLFLKQLIKFTFLELMEWGETVFINFFAWSVIVFNLLYLLENILLIYNEQTKFSWQFFKIVYYFHKLEKFQSYLRRIWEI